jgi:phytoene desaturase
MSHNVIVIGAGMGGLTAALRLAREGFRVQVLEARGEPGGLASGLELDGFAFDAGPYILLDVPGLERAFRAVGLKLAEHVSLYPLDPTYTVESGEGVTCRFLADKDETAAGFERLWPGSGARYRRFVDETLQTYRRLDPLRHISRPGPTDLIRVGAWRDAPFLLRSLGAVLDATGLPPPVRDAIAIWTHIAGQQTDDAPSPLAFVPALTHSVGAFTPQGGIAVLPRALAQAAVAAGVAFRYHTRVRAIRSEGGRVRGVETYEGAFLPANAIVSNASGVGTYLELLDATPPSARDGLKRLPLQSPGVCAYLAVRGAMESPYLRFRLPGGGELCRLLIRPGVLDAGLEQNGWWPARLMAPMRYEQAERGGPAGQRAYLDHLLGEDWWRDGIAEFHVLATRTPAEWGAAFHLYRESMNPVMTARFMRAGRLAHRSPYARGLYLAGSATHPGQWVSFCALSGVMAADQLREDFA